MNTNVITALDTRYKRKDGTYPIILRLSRNEQTLPVATEYRVPLKDWNEEKREIRNSYTGVTSVTRLNNILLTKKKAARDIILKLEEEGKADAMSLAEIKECIIQENTSASFIKFTDDLVDSLKKAGSFGNARSFEGVLSVLKDFINGTDKHANNGKAKGNKKGDYKGKDLKFTDITYKFLTKFETKHYADGNGVNGLAAYMRAIRSIFNKGIKAGAVEKDAYPFDSYTIKTEKTRKLALECKHLQKLLTADLGAVHNCFHARNYLVASYMMYGMSFADLAYLKKENMVDGRIHYRRQKTSRLYDIKITPALQEILSHYIALNPNSVFVFPVIHRETADHQNRDMISGRKNYNKQLKELAGLYGIPAELVGNMTSRVIRHSFATLARLKGVPVDVIKEMLGHSSIKTTEIYLDSLPTYTLDDYNAQVLNLNQSKTRKKE